MPLAEEWVKFINSGRGAAPLEQLYGRRPAVVLLQQARYRSLLEQFQARYPAETAIELFSSPGRTEMGGNHTDHNAGRVLAAAVDLDIIAAAAPTGDGLITLDSAGYPPISIDTRQLEPVEAERFTSPALCRGVCARFVQQGYQVGGFKACLTSAVPKGAGLSSSAAFELLVAVILNELYNGGKADPLALAQAGFFAETQYFGKPSGLMDQTTIATGGFVTIDFKDFVNPLVRKVRYDFARSGYNLVIVETGGDHADSWAGKLLPTTPVNLQNNANLAVGAGNATSTFEGVVSGSGSLTKNGSGTLNINNTNTYSGNTTVSESR